jgi:hypothetical protein
MSIPAASPDPSVVGRAEAEALPRLWSALPGGGPEPAAPQSLFAAPQSLFAASAGPPIGMRAQPPAMQWPAGRFAPSPLASSWRAAAGLAPPQHPLWPPRPPRFGETQRPFAQLPGAPALAEPGVGAAAVGSAPPGWGARAGGVADMETLAGEEAAAGRWSRWWALIVLVILAILGLVVWWIVTITMPHRPRDTTVRDLHARDLAASGDMTIAGTAVLAGATRLTSAVVQTLKLTVVSVADLAVALDGSDSAIKLTNTSGSSVTVTLPTAAENVGLVLYLFNETTNSEFLVNPAGTDTIEGSDATVVEHSSAVLVSVGPSPAGSADWKQLM